MAEIIKIDTVGYENLLKELKVQLRNQVDHLAATTIAKTATTGRLREQDRAMPSLKMGQLQQSTTGGEGNRQYGVVRTFSKQTRRGWASTTRKDSKGREFAMAHFAWDRARTTKTRKAAAYTSQLANLWGNPTKAYSTASPAVGNPNSPIRFGKGAHRKRRYFWSMTEAVMRDSIVEGIKKAEQAEKTRHDGVLK